MIMWKVYDDPRDHATLDIVNTGFTPSGEAGTTALTRFATRGPQFGRNRSLTIVTSLRVQSSPERPWPTTGCSRRMLSPPAHWG